MTDLSEEKAALREQAFAARKTAHQNRGDAVLVARDYLLASRFLTGAAIISAYRPIRTEIDPTPLMEALHEAGHQLCVPVIQGKGLPLRFAQWWPGVAMQKGPFGAAIPVDTDYLQPDLLVAPLVAFDRGCWRLGYGGGFYDRSLEELKAIKPVRAIGYAYSAQMMEAVPREPTDQRLDAVVTEAGIFRPQ